MTQSVVTVRLNGQPYQMGCDPGEEAHIEALAKEVDAIISQLRESAGQLGDARLLAMTALILADQKHNLGTAAQPPAAAGQDSSDNADNEAVAAHLEAMAQKLGQLRSRLENI